ncbi:MAG: ERF family protein [Bacillota bacterium]|nr:ERF family protein [Bacillota bacterium]
MDEEQTKELRIIDKRGKFDEVQNLPAAPNDVIMMAMQKGYTPELIEKMMALQERFEANEARKAYHVAMAKFKANPPKILRDMQVKYEVGNKVTEWSHADLATAAEAINKALGENGLNATWRTLPIEGDKTRITCIIAHELGHTEETYLESKPDTTGSKNAIQAIGSTIFYLERYTLFALTGLAPARMDDDGQKVNGDVVLLNDQQFADIQTLKADAKLSDDEFTKRLQKKFKVGTVEALTTVQANQLIKALGAIK